ncbi:MAG TPA: hypothetical protein VHM19_03665, partial [Polyangiales bacterium]|nr:hypothetical protein [Polyangiales bacterium]
MTEGRSDIDLDETIKVLVTLGVDELLARDQLEAAPEDERVQETAALVAESEAGVLLASGEELEATLFELVDALRQAGVAVALHQTASSPAIVIGEADRHVYEVQIEPGAEARALVHALATVLPDTHQLLFAPDYEEAGGLPVVVLELGTHAWLRASAGGAALDAALVPVNGKHEPPPGVRLVDITADRLLQPDFNQRFRARLPEQGSSAAVDAVWARVKGYDARIAWPDGQRRPPGDDLFELTSALAGDPL